MATQLKRMRYSKLAIVDNPANQHAMIVLAKRAGALEDDAPRGLGARIAAAITKALGMRKDGGSDPGLTPAEVAALAKDALTFDEASNQTKVWPMVDALTSSLCSILYGDDDEELTPADRAAKVKETLAQFQSAVLDLDGITKAAAPPATTENDMTKDELDAAVAAAVEKSLAPVLKAALDTATAPLAEKLTALEKVNTDQGAVIAKLLLEKGESEVTNLAKAAVGEAPIEVAAAATILKQLDPAGREAFTSLLGKSSELVKGSAWLNQLASGDGADPAGNEVETRLTKAVAAIRAADPKLTEEAAVAKAMENDPALYEELTALGG